MEIITIKTPNGDTYLNIHDESEIDIAINNLEDTIDLSKMVINYDKK